MRVSELQLNVYSRPQFAHDVLATRIRFCSTDHGSDHQRPEDDRYRSRHVRLPSLQPATIVLAGREPFRYALGLIPNSVRNARLKFDTSPKPQSSATSRTFSGSAANRTAASRKRVRKMY